MKNFLLTLCLILTGCAHQATHYKAPDASKLTKAADDYTRAVTAAHTSAKRASASLAAVKTSAATETVTLRAIQPKAEELYRRAPEPLKPLVAAMQNQISELQTQHETTQREIDVTQANQSFLESHFTEADKAKAELDRLSPSYFAQVDLLVDRANRAEAGWAKDSAEIVRMRTRSWLWRGVGILGLLAVGLVLFLKFTGRLTLSAAQIAAKF